MSLAIATLFSFSACSKVTLPPLASPPTDSHHTGKFVWLDLVTEDVEAAKKFYGGLFGWTFEDLGGDGVYTLIRHEEKPMGGIFYTDQLQDESEARWVTYLSVPDVDQATKLVTERGGEVYVKPVNYPNRGRISVVSDPQGAVVALLDSSSGDPDARELEVDEWMWNELWTTDINGAFDFYQELVGYEKEEFGAVEGYAYYLMKRDGRHRAGMVRLPWKGVEPNWLPYVLVEDPAEIVSKTESLGGKVLLSPKGVAHTGSAVITDPSGAAFAIQSRPSRRRSASN
jgi:predicted enzyme related to lactoylglutathione lyase